MTKASPTTYTIPQLDTNAIHSHISTALTKSSSFKAPYRHWLIDGFIPADLLASVQALQFSPPALNGISGKRELHNDQRCYFDEHNIRENDAIAAVAKTFQSTAIVKNLESFFDTNLNGTYLRIEYALDNEGFWLQPHTDLGVKRLTILHYISDEPEQSNLGTDIYNADKQSVKRTPFQPNTAFAFVPGDNTYHGFEPRKIYGVRKSLIINYVTTDWRAREQLCFPQSPVSS